MRVAIKHPKRKPYFADVKNKLECLQKTVGGYIECVTEDDMVIIIDEEGRLKDKPFNCYFRGIDYVGPMIFCGYKGEDFTDLPYSAKEFKELFPELYEEDT